MSNWWKRLLGLDLEDDYLDNVEAYEHRRPIAKGRVESPRNNVEVKMLRQSLGDASHYNEAVRNRQYKASLERESDPYDEPAYVRSRYGDQWVNKRKTSYQEHSSQGRKTGTNEKQESENKTYPKTRFKPTEIPSPIYGFRKRSKNVRSMQDGQGDSSNSQPLGERHTQQTSQRYEEQNAWHEKLTDVHQLTSQQIFNSKPLVGHIDTQEKRLPTESNAPKDKEEQTTYVDETGQVSVKADYSGETLPLQEEVEDEMEHQQLSVIEDDAMTQAKIKEEVFELRKLEGKVEEASEQLIDTGGAKAEKAVSAEETFKPFESEAGVDREPEYATIPKDQEAALAIEAKAVNEILDDPFAASPPLEEEGEGLHKNEIIENQDDNKTRNKGEGRNSSIPFNVLMFGADRVHTRKQKHLDSSPKLRDEPVNQLTNASIKQPSSLTLDLLNDPPESLEDDSQWIHEKQRILEETLLNFHVKAEIVSYVQGPAVTRFELKLHPGVKINKILSLTEDIKLSMAAKQIRIAPVPGKSIVGIEIPNSGRKPVFLKQLLQSENYLHSHSPLTATLGMDVSGHQVVTDLAKMPHGLIAGATGSGKSVFIHSLLLSLIYKTNPEDLRLILIDPKVVELAAYRQLPHLAAPLITQPKEAALALKWAVSEMEERYQRFAQKGVRDIQRYNQASQESTDEKMPYIIIVIDELADLMMASPQDVEEAICRIAQKARAAGIHMLLATQRPSVDVITGLIKSNIPTRIAFSVSSQADSRTILDVGGAERLLGQGDMLFVENGARDMKRLQGAFVTDEEIVRVTEALKRIEPMPFLFNIEQIQEQRMDFEAGEDDLFEEAIAFVIEQGQASVSSLQRRFRIGYNRAARLVDQLEAGAIISEANGSKPRQVLVNKDADSESKQNKALNR